MENSENGVGVADGKEQPRFAFRPIFVAPIILAVTGIVLATAFILSGRKGGSPTMLASANHGGNAGYAAGTPINKVDPVSGDPVTSGITSNHRGYVIGHCCPADRKQWEDLAPDIKDGKLQGFLRELQEAARPSPQGAPAAAKTINLIDPLSGHPVTEGVTSTYKGHLIGHCCLEGKKRWEALTPAAKDEKIRGFLREQGL